MRRIAIYIADVAETISRFVGKFSQVPLSEVTQESSGADLGCDTLKQSGLGPVLHDSN